ncbi:MAG TPA: DUF72 domain-containing protein, partial [Candidatus Binataceae bacterium]|nr:DUF72 domain-containing protein [Candidatus Binataceae bacterium]
LDYFIETAHALGERLGPVLFQLPPDLARDDALLADFIGQIDGRVKSAFEFRNKSWFAEPVLEALRKNGAALCIAESDKLASPVERTSPHIYLRLRKETYDEAALAQWADRIRALANDNAEVYIYFKHEAAAPELATRLQALLTNG